MRLEASQNHKRPMFANMMRLCATLHTCPCKTAHKNQSAAKVHTSANVTRSPSCRLKEVGDRRYSSTPWRVVSSWRMRSVTSGWAATRVSRAALMSSAGRQRGVG